MPKKKKTDGRNDPQQRKASIDFIFFSPIHFPLKNSFVFVISRLRAFLKIYLLFKGGLGDLTTSPHYAPYYDFLLCLFQFKLGYVRSASQVDYLAGIGPCSC